jgi:hypothetical protein
MPIEIPKTMPIHKQEEIMKYIEPKPKLGYKAHWNLETPNG